MTQALLNFTDRAASKVAELIRDEGNPALNLRVFISGGGCSGFQYGFTFDEEINTTEDHVITKEIEAAGSKEQVRLVVDPASFQYLAGAEIDYREDGGGGSWVIRNPNAKTTCGCGSSFSADVGEEKEE